MSQSGDVPVEVIMRMDDERNMLTEDKHQLLVSLGAQIDRLKDRVEKVELHNRILRGFLNTAHRSMRPRP